MDIQLEGYEEFEELLENMVFSPEDKKKSIRNGMKVIAKHLEEDTPKGKTGKLSKIKTKVNDEGLYTEGVAYSSAFYDIFQEFGTSEQKAHIGYFDRSVKNSEDEAVEAAAKILLGKIR